MIIDNNLETIKKLTEKYPLRATMYVEYPHKKFWRKDFHGNEFRASLQTFFSRDRNAPLLLYIHIPFCPKRCLYCNCYTFITSDHARIKNYLNFLYKEIELYRDFFKKKSITPNFKEIHLGGGSPTMLDEKEFNELVKNIGYIVDMDNVSEFSLEIDPRSVNKDKMRYYRKKGINRISLGVQDFDPLVQKAVNRIQPTELTSMLCEPDIRNLFENGYNFDVICGLPLQTRDSIKKTFEKITKMAPDRICFNYFHHTPEFAPHQSLMIDGRFGRPTQFPDLFEKKLLFLEGQNILEKNGYLRTGYDHFAKPTDEVGKAMKGEKMHWNSLGVTAGRYDDVICLGLQSFGKIGNCYYQNYFEFRNYEEAVEQGKFPIFRGYAPNQDDTIRRDVIQAIRNFFYLNFHEIEKKYNIDFKKYFKKEIDDMKEFIADGILEPSKSEIKITEIGKLFADQVCKIFDIYIR